ncbi:MAG: glycosyltransferase family 2 protein [Lachnospiraceae bacterium]|nr:glycosyltransferase family 2 protein [Lachnospiraceae bacterium]
MEKILTVSIAAYNVEKYLRETLDSLISPDIADELEVLIIDDGSTDSTPFIAREYEERFPGTMRLISKENGGYGSTINRGLKEARGRYFRQLDGDDRLSGGLAGFVRDIKEAHEDLILTQVIRWNESTGEENIRDYVRNAGEGSHLFDDIEVPDIITMHSATYRTDFLRKYGRKITEHCFYTDLEYVTYPLPHVKTVRVLHRPLYVYRTGAEGQSISRTGIRKHYREHRKVLVHLCRLYRKYREDLGPAATDAIEARLSLETVMHMKYLCMTGMSVGHFMELRGFLAEMNRHFPEVMRIAKSRSGFARVMAASGGLIYPVFCLTV